MGPDACRRLGTEAVDLVVLDDAPAPLGHRVLKRGRLLSGTQPRRRAAVAEHILRRSDSMRRWPLIAAALLGPWARSQCTDNRYTNAYIDVQTGGFHARDQDD